jgi:hypothetical protein
MGVTCCKSPAVGEPRDALPRRALPRRHRHGRQPTETSADSCTTTSSHFDPPPVRPPTRLAPGLLEELDVDGAWASSGPTSPTHMPLLPKSSPRQMLTNGDENQKGGSESHRPLRSDGSVEHDALPCNTAVGPFCDVFFYEDGTDASAKTPSAATVVPHSQSRTLAPPQVFGSQSSAERRASQSTAWARSTASELAPDMLAVMPDAFGGMEEAHDPQRFQSTIKCASTTSETSQYSEGAFGAAANERTHKATTVVAVPHMHTSVAPPLDASDCLSSPLDCGDRSNSNHTTTNPSITLGTTNNNNVSRQSRSSTSGLSMLVFTAIPQTEEEASPPMDGQQETQTDCLHTTRDDLFPSILTGNASAVGSNSQWVQVSGYQTPARRTIMPCHDVMGECASVSGQLGDEESCVTAPNPLVRPFSTDSTQHPLPFETKRETAHHATETTQKQSGIGAVLQQKAPDHRPPPTPPPPRLLVLPAMSSRLDSNAKTSAAGGAPAKECDFAPISSALLHHAGGSASDGTSGCLGSVDTPHRKDASMNGGTNGVSSSQQRQSIPSASFASNREMI